MSSSIHPSSPVNILLRTISTVIYSAVLPPSPMVFFFGQPNCAITNFEDGNVVEEVLEYSDHIFERIARVAKDANLVLVTDRGLSVGASLSSVVQQIPAEDGAPEKHSSVLPQQGRARGNS